MIFYRWTPLKQAAFTTTNSFRLVKAITRLISLERRNLMFTPNAPYDEMESVLPEWHEPFPKPQTIPSGWDISEILSASSSTPTKDEDRSANG
jgi:hypothetical protein